MGGKRLISFYDMKRLFFLRVERISMLGTLSPPGGNRKELSSRFFKEFNLIHLNDLTQ